MNSYKQYIQSFEWGPSITKTIISLDGTVMPGDVSLGSFLVTVETKDMDGIKTVKREITDAYLSDECGNKKSVASNFITLAYQVGAEALPNFGGIALAGTTPFYMDMELPHIIFTKPNHTININDLAVGGKKISLTIPPDACNGKITPMIDDMRKGKLKADGKTLTFAAFEPNWLRGDKNKKPLVIWLHGAGEGGTDIDIPLLGGNITAFMTDPIQKYLGGAFVLAIQNPTVWMDAGQGQHQGDEPSIYTAALKQAIDEYIASNADIDLNRIYIGGCSNGGYMTVNMLIEYPGFFAAAYAICEAYADSYITEEKLNKLAQTPVWFVHSRDDEVVPPQKYVIPTYERLKSIGANAHINLFDTVIGSDAPGLRYQGHWSWIYASTNRCFEGQTSLWEWLAGQRL